MIEIKNITVTFDDKLVLEDISCDIEKQKITSIIGRSGEGKSVLMKTVLGLIKPRFGDIIIDDISIFTQNKQELKTVKSKTAMLFQNSALFDSMDVFQNIGFPLFEHTKLPLEEIQERVLELLSLVDLSKETMNKYPSELSGGMRKRVALARAMIQEPEYLIYDEPTTGLDPITAKEITNLIGKIHDKLGMTSIIITHESDVIKKLSENLIMIDSKQIIFKGDLAGFNNFAHPIAEAFKNS